MIQIVKGNILEADVEALVNPVNCVGVMGKGLALQFKSKFPEMFEDYKAACRDSNFPLKPGGIHVFHRGRKETPRYILNLATKSHWKLPSKLQSVQDGLFVLREVMNSKGITSVAIPAMGCGLGSLKWPDVLHEIVKVMENLPGKDILIYEP